MAVPQFTVSATVKERAFQARVETQKQIGFSPGAAGICQILDLPFGKVISNPEISAIAGA